MGQFNGMSTVEVMKVQNRETIAAIKAREEGRRGDAKACDSRAKEAGAEVSRRWAAEDREVKAKMQRRG